MDVSIYMKWSCGDLYGFRLRKNKANLHGRRNLPKPSPKPAALRLPPSEEKVLFEKTKPIYKGTKLAQSLIRKGIMRNCAVLGDEKTKPNKANLPAFGRKL